MTKQHAINTARILNEMNPDFMRTRRFIPRRGTPLYEEWRNGIFSFSLP
ncbi:MAG: hypothetical protein QW457_07370 [Candidatus Bathyarchaeia archaeon]